MTTTATANALRLPRGRKTTWSGTLIFGCAIALGTLYVVTHLIRDLQEVHNPSILPFLLLGLALFVALGFEFVNGFHDTANAVATVIYTHSLDPQIAVVWSGAWNFAGVLFSSGVVAFGIVSLLPVDLILQVGTASGFAMVFALLVAAIIWNLGTWYLGLPSSSSHTLIGSIIGVGIANQLIAPNTGTSGVDWAQAVGVGKSLLLSPLVGFVCAASLLMVAQGRHPAPRALRESSRHGTAAAVDSPVAHLDLHRRQLRPRVQRRPEGDGPHHAHPDRHRSDCLCVEPRSAGDARPRLRRRVGAGRRRARVTRRWHGAGWRAAGSPDGVRPQSHAGAGDCASASAR